MSISATYICPVRGLVDLDSPEPQQLARAAGIAGSLGIERLLLPVLEEAITGSVRKKVDFLDGLIRALDHVAEVGLGVWLNAPAQRVLGLIWVPPLLVKAVRGSEGSPVFTAGKIRNLRPFDWWADPALIQKRVKVFRELVTAVSGHPALRGWVILDRFLEWSRPSLEVADLLLRSYLSEIRERDEKGTVFLGLGWSELLEPEIARSLARQVDGVWLSGFESPPPVLGETFDSGTEILMASFAASLSRWIIEATVEIEVGWGAWANARDPEKTLEAVARFREQEETGTCWLNLIDPQPAVAAEPPWALRPGLDRVGLLDRGSEPKELVETLLKAFRTEEAKDNPLDFIDLSREEYLADPQTHFFRLWDHFRE